MNIGEHDPSGHLLGSELSEKIVGAAVQVRNELKLGLDEMLYENALLIELTEHGTTMQQQKWCPAMIETILPEGSHRI